MADFNPWVSLSWMVSGRTVGGLTLYPEANRLDRATALRLYTPGLGLDVGRGHTRQPVSIPLVRNPG